MKYYLGLDMGTNSLGWAVTDDQYRLIRKKGKDFWGVREFERAETSADRRSHRISRRRRQREIARIGILKSYFADEIEKIDPNFFSRLDNSKYHLEDKDEAVRTYNGIFNDSDYHDEDYFRDYPTIFHLRKELIENPNAHDVRLVYLALLNMFKHRGHFLNSSISGDDSDLEINECYEALAEILNNRYDLSFEPGIGLKIQDVLSDRNLNRTKKYENLLTLLNADKKDKQKAEFIKSICGLKTDGRIMFPDLELEEKVEICFSDYGYDEKTEEIISMIGDDAFDIVEMLKQLYDIGALAGILKGYSYLSLARVDMYEKHKSDLALLKRIFRKYATNDDYDWMFRSENEGSYSAYVNSVNSGIKNRRNMKGRKIDDLYKSIKKYIKSDHIDDPDVQYLYDEMDKQTFLPKQLNAGNGVIPNQVHQKEMIRILRNAELYLPFLLEKDESGMTVSERIVALFKFQIPYYIGPVTEKSSRDNGTGWVIRREPGTVLPWNFEQKIDTAATAERFIERMVRNCTYLSGEKAMAKASLDYEKFAVLNEINNLKIDGERISVNIKQDIFNELFLTGKKITRKQLVQYLKARGLITEDAQLTGIDTNLNNYLPSYGKFYAVLGDDLKLDKTRAMVEDIINLATIFGDSKKLLKSKIVEKYGEVLSESQIKRILGFKFKDWGRFSRAFLELQGCDKSSGVVISIISALWENNINLMELINSPDFTFKEELESKQKNLLKPLKELKYEDLEEYYFSSPVRRMIWQTLLVIREIEKVMGSAPDRIFVEMTREDQEKGDAGRKDSRAKQLEALYKKIKDENRNWVSEIENADNSGLLRSKKIYLYYTQMGRCMYSGEQIDFEDLLNANSKYDIDHIYPRHYVKDDNISNNLVLVKKETNAYKSDDYPIVSETRNNPKIRELWLMLRSKGLITEEKYSRLTGSSPFTDEQKAGFIARQLVETSQGMKGIADILKQAFSDTDTKIVYSKGSNVSDFRNKNGLLKSRTINDFHHAKDAYLNIVVGNVYFTKFTQNPRNFIEKEAATGSYHLDKMFERDVIRNGETAWIAYKSGTDLPPTIETVKKMMGKNTPLLTRMNFENHGVIGNETLYSHKKAKADNYFPFKSSDKKIQDVEKYGGFTSAKAAYFMLVESGSESKRIRSLESVPIYMKDKLENSSVEMKKYLENKLGLINPDVRYKKIKIQSLIKIDGYYYCLAGKTGNQIIINNTAGMILNQDWVNYLKKVDNYSEKKYLDKEITGEKNLKLYDELIKKHKESIYSLRQNPVGIKLENGREKFTELSLEEQCYIIEQILLLSAIGGYTADLGLIEGSSMTGKMRYNKKISEAKEFKLINQSVTGIYQKEIDLLKI